MSRTRQEGRARQCSRELLVKALYQWQLAGHDAAELELQFSQEPEFDRSDRRYFRELLGFAIDEAPDYDRAITLFATRPLDQLDAVGHAVLLLALAELKHRHDVPTKVVINEAVELAKRYGATDSYRFVNAVLDRASKAEGFRAESVQ